MRPEPRPPEINVTPLVDVVLVLLIIFMVVIPQLEAGAAIDVPAAHNPDSRSGVETDAITVSVTMHGEIFVDRQPIARAALVPLLADMHRRQKDRPLRIKGDRRTRYEAVRGVFRDCQRVGFPGVALEVGEIARDGRDLSESRAGDS
jgi:biopolymer transport protein TolR